MTGTSASVWPRRLRLVVRCLGVAAVLALLVVGGPHVMDTPDLGVSTAVVSSALLVACGVLWLFDRFWAATMGSLAAAAIVAVSLAADRGASSLERALGAAARPLIAPLLAASILPTCGLAVAGLAAGWLAGPVHALTYDPFFDPGCVKSCEHPPFTIRHWPRVASFAESGGLWLAAVALTVAVLHIPRHRFALACVAAAAWWELGAHDMRALLAASAMVAFVLGRRAVDTVVAFARLREVVTALGSDDDLQGSLRSATRDASLSIDYWIDEFAEATSSKGRGAFVSSDGELRSHEPAVGNETLIRRDGRVLAVIRASDDGTDVDALAALLNGPARLTFEVERLRALTAVQARHMSASRSRIVASGDLERRLLERNIHDGAQQDVLSLGMNIELALLDVAPDDPRRPVLERCLDGVSATLNELRGLSHLISPFPLEIGGLDAALHAVSTRADVPVTIHSSPLERLDIDVERTVISVVQAAVVMADGPVDVSVICDAGVVKVCISGVDGSALHAASSDRVLSSGGSVQVAPGGVEVVVPCASS